MHGSTSKAEDADDDITSMVEYLNQRHVHSSTPVLRELEEVLVNLKTAQNDCVAFATESECKAMFDSPDYFSGSGTLYTRILVLADARLQLDKWIKEMVSCCASKLASSWKTHNYTSFEGTVKSATDRALVTNDVTQCMQEADKLCAYHAMRSFTKVEKCGPFCDLGLTKVELKKGLILYEWSYRYLLCTKDELQAGPTLQMLVRNEKLEQILLMNEFERMHPLQSDFPCHGTRSCGSALVVSFRQEECQTGQSRHEVNFTVCREWRYTLDTKKDMHEDYAGIRFGSLELSAFHFWFPINLNAT